MPQTPHIERHFTANDSVRDVAIGMSDGLTMPFALAAGLSGAVGTRLILVASPRSRPEGSRWAWAGTWRPGATPSTTLCARERPRGNCPCRGIATTYGDASPRRAPAVSPCKRRSEHSGALAGDPSAARRPGRHDNAPAELARRACQQHPCLLPPVRARAGEQTPRSLEPPREPPRHPLAAAGCLDRVELARDPPHRRLENLVGRRRAASPRRRAVVEARQDARVVDHRPPRDRTRSDAVRELPGKAAEETVRVRDGRSEEHTSELQSQSNLVCRLLLEKKKK